MATTVEEVTPTELEEMAQEFLSNTDWMVWKSVEDTTYTIPTDVAEKRAFARTLIDTSAHKAKLDVNIRPIFYSESDHLLAFKQLIVYKETELPE